MGPLIAVQVPGLLFNRDHLSDFSCCGISLLSYNFDLVPVYHMVFLVAVVGKGRLVVFSLRFLSLGSRELFLGIQSHVSFMFSDSVLQGSACFYYVGTFTLFTGDLIHHTIFLSWL